MRLLAFDTCLDKTYITLTDGKEFINKVIVSDNENYHSAYLISTIVEILKASNLTPKDLDYIAVGFGTGGTLCGTARYFKEKASRVKFIGIEPEQSPLITKSYAKPHLIQGIGANFIPEILDAKLVDEFISVDDKKSIEMAKKLFELEQLFVGYSTGANVLGIIEYIKNNNIKNKTFLTFAMDKGDRYTWN